MGLYDIAKDAARLAQKLDNIELVQKIMDLQRAAMEADEERFQLRRQVERLKEQLATHERIQFRDSMYWIDGEEKPFCSRCYDKDGQLVRLHTWGNDQFKCPACSTFTRNPDYRESISGDHYSF